MNVKTEKKFDVIVASHYGMCFGVKAAIETAQKLAAKGPITVLGELAHNATVMRDLQARGASHGKLEAESAPTKHVLITAHGASDRDRARWADQGYQVTDTTCPLVHRAHNSLRQLVLNGYEPVVIGKPGHVEVRGLVGDFPETAVVQSLEDVQNLRLEGQRIGVISQTTQQIDYVQEMVQAIREQYLEAEVRFIDTVCRPTKDRQKSLLELCEKVQLVIVVGGVNSNNTAQLAEKCRSLGCAAYHVQSPSCIDSRWFNDIERVGLTAGTSTPQSDITAVQRRLNRLSEVSE